MMADQLRNLFFFLCCSVGDNNKYEIHLPLPPKIDPTVTMMQVEEKPDVTYNDVGGCKEQIEKLKEVVETPLLHVRLSLSSLSSLSSLFYSLIEPLNFQLLGQECDSPFPSLPPSLPLSDIDEKYISI